MKSYQALHFLLEQVAKLIATYDFSTPAGHKLHETAKACLGRDVAPRENEFGCAEAVNQVVFRAFGDYAGGDLSTYRMYHALMNHKKFVRVKQPKPGDIILSPTGYGNGKIPNGHTGIIGHSGIIMSNNSHTGIW